MAREKKKAATSNSMSSLELTLLLLLIVILVLIAFVRMGTLDTSSLRASKILKRGSSVAPADKYKVLFDRAAELTKRYKEVSNSSSLPHELQVLEKLSTLDLGTGIAKPDLHESRPVETSTETKSASVVSVSGENVVLGMAQDTDAKNLAVFWVTFSHSNADVILFVNSPVPTRHKTIAHDNRITLIEFDLDDMDVSMKKYHPSTLRWVLFHNYFMDNKELAAKYKRAWMIDVRDSYFQEDPFAFVIAEETSKQSVFHAFNGVESMKISTCGWNSGWIKDCFGDQMLQKVGNNNIICSGVSVAPMDIALRYISLMNSVITSQEIVPSLGYKSKFPTCERNGVDQGVHNVLMHTNALQTTAKADNVDVTVKRWSQKDSPVANMQAKMMNVRNNEVFNSVGAKVAVVHQYDRYPELQQWLFSKYVDWVNANDFAAVWADEPTCERFNYKENSDLFKGRCDLKMMGGAATAATCCKHCTNTQECKAFAFVSGVCYMKSCTQQNPSGSEMRGAVSGYLK